MAGRQVQKTVKSGKEPILRSQIMGGYYRTLKGEVILPHLKIAIFSCFKFHLEIQRILVFWLVAGWKAKRVMSNSLTKLFQKEEELEKDTRLCLIPAEA